MRVDQVPILVKNRVLFEKKGFKIEFVKFNETGDALVVIVWIGQLDNYVKELMVELFPPSDQYAGTGVKY